MKRSLFGTVAIAAVALSVVLIGAASAAKPPPAPSSGGCPNGNVANYPESSIVGADFEINGSTTKYTFGSVDQNSNTTVPGLVGYCVYVNTAPASDTTAGGDVPTWKASKPGKSFGFTRPGGESTNIPLDGNTYTVGFATWTGTVPATQTILLHVSGTAANVCNGLPSCYVRPTLELGPICDAGKGSSDFAYNAMPFDIYNGCPPLDSYSFEGQLPTKEFGDEVQLAGTGTKIKSMTVSFDSWGCGTSGHWYDTNGACTTGSETFLIPPNGTDPAGIRANIYDGTGDTVGALLGTATNTGPFPFRPSADNVKCVNPGTDVNGGDDRGKWYNALANRCLNGFAFPVTFDFSSLNIDVPASGKVIWTVTYNTSNSGTTPFGNLTACRIAGDPGCGYDSLNVDDWTFANAPYAGGDVNPDAQWIDRGLGGGLAAETGHTGFTPDAQITTG
jgi:hypothetical protein